MKTPAQLYGRFVMNSFVQIAIIVALVAAGAYLYIPLWMGGVLKDRLEKSRLELAELEVCFPLYVELARLDVPAQWPDLALPPPEKLTERDIASVTDRFMQIATNSLVELVTVSPRVQTDEKDGRYLAVDLRATGPYRQLKSFLLGLVQMPPLERIEKLEIRREALQEQFDVAVRLALE